jgi:hypothetical protein
MAECWVVNNQHKNKISVAEMRMLRWMCCKTYMIELETRLSRFGHVERRLVDSVIRSYNLLLLSHTPVLLLLTRICMVLHDLILYWFIIFLYSFTVYFLAIHWIVGCDISAWILNEFNEGISAAFNCYFIPIWYFLDGFVTIFFFFLF